MIHEDEAMMCFVLLMVYDTLKRVIDYICFIFIFSGSWKPCKVKKRRMPPKQRKIAVMGSRSVGKSSLAIQFAQVFIFLTANEPF